jgi:hypothetical protein
MEKKKIPLPIFKSIGEMAFFFDNNSPLDGEGFEEVDITFVKAEGKYPERAVYRFLLLLLALIKVLSVNACNSLNILDFIKILSFACCRFSRCCRVVLK